MMADPVKVNSKRMTEQGIERPEKLRKKGGRAALTHRLCHEPAIQRSDWFLSNWQQCNITMPLFCLMTTPRNARWRYCCSYLLTENMVGSDTGDWTYICRVMLIFQRTGTCTHNKLLVFFKRLIPSWPSAASLWAYCYASYFWGEPVLLRNIPSVGTCENAIEPVLRLLTVVVLVFIPKEHLAPWHTL